MSPQIVLTCAYCGGPSEGHYAIHRDDFGVGPEVDLCDACGGSETPTCEGIWERISRHDTSNVISLSAYKLVRMGFGRVREQ